MIPTNHAYWAKPAVRLELTASFDMDALSSALRSIKRFRVRRGGDRALTAYARKFDRLEGAIEITAAEIEEGARQAPASVRRALHPGRP